MTANGDRIKKALQDANARESLDRVFGGRLSHEGVVVVDDPQSNSLILSWSDGETVHRMPIDRANPSPYAIESLSALQSLDSEVRERGNEDAVRSCFDADSLARSFLNDYREVLGAFSSVASDDEETATLNRFMTRVLLVRFVQTKGWFTFGGRKDYLQALYEDWKASPGPRCFYQRLAIVFFNALNEPRQESRWLVRNLVGEVPHLGGGLFAPELYEREMQTRAGFAMVPDALFDALMGETGLLTRYEFSLEEDTPSERVVAITPSVMGAVFEAYLAGEREPVYPNASQLRQACREVVAKHLGLQGLDTDSMARLGTEIVFEKLDGIHIYDGECRSGSYLVSALEELASLYCQYAPGGGDKSFKSAIKRRVVSENIRGLDKEDLSVQVARFRLALSVCADDLEPTPLPDLRTVVKKGGAISGDSAKWRFPAEGQHVEYKASFEWDTRGKRRSEALRHATLKTIVAFLNSEGGTLYLGVRDTGVPVGIGPDLDLIGDAFRLDAFQNRFREILKNHIDPIPLSRVTMTFEEAMGITIAMVKVSPQKGINYLVTKDQHGRVVESVYVRDGNRTVELVGRARDQFVVQRARDV